MNVPGHRVTVAIKPSQVARIRDLTFIGTDGKDLFTCMAERYSSRLSLQYANEMSIQRSTKSSAGRVWRYYNYSELHSYCFFSLEWGLRYDLGVSVKSFGLLYNYNFILRDA